MFYILFLFVLISDSYNPTTFVFPPSGHSMGYHKVTDYSIKMLLGEDLSFSDPQGIVIVKLDNLDDSSTGNDDDELTFFAVNSQNGEIIYNVSFSAVRTYGSVGTGERNLWDPMGITANTSGDVFVADKSNHRIVHLKYSNGELKFLNTIGDGYGMSPGQLSNPIDVTLDGTGKIYVTEQGNNRISIFNKEGDFIKVIGVGYLSEPFGISLIDRRDRWNYYRDRNYLVVTDAKNTRITTFDLEGNRLKSLNGMDIDLEETYFSYVAIGYYGMIYLSDRINSQIHIFTRDLKYITSFGREGSGDKEFHSPRGISIWKRFGQILILEQQSAQYYWLGIDGFVKGAFPSTFTKDQPGSTISLFITQPSNITLTIWDSNGNIIRNLLPEFKETPGYTQILWDGKDNNSEIVSPGTYTVKMLLEPSYSSKGYFEKELEINILCTEEILSDSL